MRAVAHSTAPMACVAVGPTPPVNSHESPFQAGLTDRDLEDLEQTQAVADAMRQQDHRNDELQHVSLP